jgi:hypothetical protein
LKEKQRASAAGNGLSEEEAARIEEEKNELLGRLAALQREKDQQQAQLECLKELVVGGGHEEEDKKKRRKRQRDTWCPGANLSSSPIAPRPSTSTSTSFVFQKVKEPRLSSSTHGDHGEDLNASHSFESVVTTSVEVAALQEKLASREEEVASLQERLSAAEQQHEAHRASEEEKSAEMGRLKELANDAANAYVEKLEADLQGKTEALEQKTAELERSTEALEQVRLVCRSYRGRIEIA